MAGEANKQSLVICFKKDMFSDEGLRRLRSIMSLQSTTPVTTPERRVLRSRNTRAAETQNPHLNANHEDDLDEGVSKPSVLRKRAARESNVKTPPAKKVKVNDPSDDDFVGHTTSEASGSPDPDASSAPLTPASSVASENISSAKKKSVPKKATKTSKEPWYKNTTLEKPEPCGTPEVWADKRQQLCETLPYYRAYQSGAYNTDSKLLGFLIDAKVGDMDYIDSEVIITTSGGDRMQDAEGNFTQGVSSDKKPVALAALNTMALGGVVVLIIGQGNTISPSKLSHYYSVLGHFQITDVWRETQSKTWKFRFEKIDLTNQSWWAPKGTYPSDSEVLVPDYVTKCPELVCGMCKQISKHIYEQSWVCLKATCAGFFKSGGMTLNTGTLAYTKTFLGERQLFKGSQPGPLAPALPTLADINKSGVTPYNQAFRGGIVCPKCGCCSRRTQWHQWKCENSGCDFEYFLQARTVHVSEAIAEGNDGDQLRKASEFCDPSILSDLSVVAKYDVHKFVLPGPNNTIAGTIYLFKPHSLVRQQTDGPDDLFEQLQPGGNSFKLTRGATRNASKPSEIITSHFASNFGAIYKYGVTPMTTGFDEAPAVILKALKRLTWAGEQAVANGDGELFVAFNELLLLGYFEKGHIDYHDDGESTLGPTVASLSLGADATMSFRPKKKSTIGVAGKSVRGNKPDMLKLTLEHGDLLVMHGTGIHKEYEHAVTPHGKLRFALTGRFVIPERMDSQADTDFARRGGTLPAGHEQYDYDGDINAQPVERNTRAAIDNLLANIAVMEKTGVISAEKAQVLLQTLRS